MRVQPQKEESGLEGKKKGAGWMSGVPFGRHRWPSQTPNDRFGLKLAVTRDVPDGSAYDGAVYCTMSVGAAAWAMKRGDWQ